MINTFPPNINGFINELENPVYEVAPVALFAVFSRFEYAMKRADYVKAKSATNETCEPDWQEFEKENENAYANVVLVGLLEAKTYFDTMPPRKQVYSDGKMKWKDAVRDGQSDLAWHAQSIRRVRNNLFHGEKTSAFMQINSNLPEEKEPSRNILLIRHSLVMLEAFLECDDKLKTAFHSFIPGTSI